MKIHGIDLNFLVFRQVGKTRVSLLWIKHHADVEDPGKQLLLLGSYCNSLVIEIAHQIRW